MIKLQIGKTLNWEIAHFCTTDLQIFSRFNRICFVMPGVTREIRLPTSLAYAVLGEFRLLRRLLRLDKMCVIPTDVGFVAVWQGCVYFIGKDMTIKRTLRLVGCRNPLHNSIVVIEGKTVVFGEYGKPNKNGKSVYQSRDGGLSWKKMLTIPCDRIRHIHSCKWDPYERKIWVFTGDFDGQAYAIKCDLDFTEMKWIGDGSQIYRAVDAIFEEKTIHWIMDSPLLLVHHILLDRSDLTIKIGQVFPGPVWYMKRLRDGTVLACSVQEIGPSHTDDKIHLFRSEDLRHWEDIATFCHDGYKKGLFKFGVGSFAAGDEGPEHFYMHFEAVRGLDGKVAEFSLIEYTA